MTLPLGLNLTLFSVGLLGILFIFLLITIVQNSFITFTPKSIGRFSMLTFLIGFLLPWIIIGDSIMIYLTAFLVIVFIVLTLRSRSKSKKKSTTQAVSHNNNS